MTLGLICLTAFGCASKNATKPDPSVVKFEKFRQTYDAATDPRWSAEEERVFERTYRNKRSSKKTYSDGTIPAGIGDSSATRIVLSRAHRAIGTPYVFGGTKPGGFDCSGLVQWAYKGAGIKLPRTAAEQSRSGFSIRDKSKMRAGDIVAFKRRGGYHTGIYLGDGKFIHAPSTNKRVRIESLSTDYFARNFIGARRVDMRGRSTEVAAAVEKMDRQYEKSSRKSVAKKKSEKEVRKTARSRSGRTYEVASTSKRKDVRSSRGKSQVRESAAVKKSSRSAARSQSKVKKETGKTARKATAQKRETRKAQATRKSSQATASRKADVRKTAKKADSKQIRVRPARQSVDQARANKARKTSSQRAS